MSSLMNVIQEADLAALEVEKAKQAFENARQQLERSRALLEESQSHFNQILAQSEEYGVSKSKIRKLMEERVALLMSSGLITSQIDEAPIPRISKTAKSPRKKASPLENEIDPAPSQIFEEETKILHA